MSKFCCLYCLNMVIQITLTYILHFWIWIDWQYFKYYCKSLTSVCDCSACLTYCSMWKNSMHLRTYFPTERASVNVFFEDMTCKKLAENASKTLKACKIFKSCYSKKSLTSCCFFHTTKITDELILFIFCYFRCAHTQPIRNKIICWRNTLSQETLIVKKHT